jgi:hypothetical protein
MAAFHFHKNFTTMALYSQHSYTAASIIQSFSGREGFYMKKVVPSSAFSAVIEKAVLALKARDFSSSRQIISGAMAMNMDAPEPHNLLGILYELQGDDSAARQHYRAAYALDPTYKPSCRNLERLVLYGFNVIESYDYGANAAGEQNPAAAKT